MNSSDKASHIGFGHWVQDEWQLPVFDYTSPRKEPYFFLGNHRLTLFCTVDGVLQVVTGELSWMRMNHGGGFSGAHEAGIEVDGVSFPVIGAPAVGFIRRSFGCSEIVFESEHGGVCCRRIVSVMPDSVVADALPAFSVRVELENRSGFAKSLNYVERIRANPVMLKYQWGDNSSPVRYRAEFIPSKRAGLCVIFSADLADPHLAPDRSRPAAVDAFPPALHVQAVGGEVTVASQDWVEIRSRLVLKPGEVADFVWGAALEFPRDAGTTAGRLAGLLGQPRAEFRQAWRERIPDFSDEPDEGLRTELAWHAHALEAMATYDEWDAEVFIPQGSNYDYRHFSACPRDHLQHALGVMGFHPELAKSVLRRVLGQMSQRGEMAYMRFGAGLSTNGMWHTSDQQLYLFHAILEYLRSTGDRTFLAEEVRIYPPESGCRRTVIEAIEIAFVYLRDEVGTGHRGLPRLMNSDWNDGMFYGRPLRYPDFMTASSHAYAAMAAALIEPLADEMEKARASLDWPRGRILLASMRAYGRRITTALLADFDGRAFARRAYLGDGSPLGEDVMFLEPQPWLLMLPAFEHKAYLWQEIQRRLCDGEPLGSRCIERSEDGHAGSPIGEGENGGFWYALHGQLVAGLGELDPAAARVMLKRMSLRNFAENYPDAWYGHWSGSDTVNSSLADEPGRMSRLDLSRELTPIPCGHPHAYSLFGHAKIRAAEKALAADQQHFTRRSSMQPARATAEPTLASLPA